MGMRIICNKQCGVGMRVTCLEVAPLSFLKRVEQRYFISTRVGEIWFRKGFKNVLLVFFKINIRLGLNQCFQDWIGY